MTAVQPYVAWVKQNPIFNTIDYDANPRIVVDHSDNLVVVYQTSGNVSGYSRLANDDIAVFKMDSLLGQILWTKQISTVESDINPAVSVDSMNNIYIAYQHNEPEGGLYNIIVNKLDPSNGSIIWSVTFGSISFFDDTYPSICVDHADNIYVVYETDGGTTSGQTNTGLSDIVITKLEPLAGDILWIKQQPTFNTIGGDFYPSCAVDSLNNIYVSYETNSVASGQTGDNIGDIVVFKLQSTTGEQLWVSQNFTYNTIDNDDSVSIAIDTSNNIYITYITYDITSGQTLTPDSGHNTVVFKLEPDNGYTLWTRQQPIFNAPTAGFYSTPSICVDISGGVYVLYTSNETVSGQTRAFGSYTEDIVIFKLNSNGETMWVYQQPIFDIFPVDGMTISIKVDSLGNIYASYMTNGTMSGQTNTGSVDIVVLKLLQQQPPCFNHGTKILCYNNQSIPIQDLRSGDLVKTFRHGYRRVEMIGCGSLVNDPTRWESCMYRYGDLVVTGGHSILQDHPPQYPEEKKKQKEYWGDSQYTLDGYYMILASVSHLFTQITDHNTYTYYHIILEDDGSETRHYGIWADGVLTESLPRINTKSSLSPILEW